MAYEIVFEESDDSALDTGSLVAASADQSDFEMPTCCGVPLATAKRDGITVQAHCTECHHDAPKETLQAIQAAEMAKRVSALEAAFEIGEPYEISFESGKDSEAEDSGALSGKEYEIVFDGEEG